MRQLQSVVWSKGVFLSPQHLQAQDHFFDNLLRFTLEAAAFAYWGFTKLQIEGSSIAEGRLQVASAAGFFPDGLAFDTSESDEAPRSRSLQECFEDGRVSCLFYLAIPQSRSGGINIAPLRSGMSSRFHSQMMLLRDENSSGVEKPVSLAKKNLQIIAEGESLEGMVSVPLARILLAESGRFVLDREFTAPMLNLHGSDLLLGILRGLVETLHSRGGQLAGSRRQRNQSLADFSASDIASFWLLYTINTHLPVFHQWMEGSQLHPERFYSEMLALGGSLTTFSREIGPSDFPRYEHENQGKCFLSMEVKLLQLLNTVIPSRFLSLPLRKAGDSIYVTDIERDEYLQNTRAYLAIQAEMPAADLILRGPSLVKACSATHLETLIRQALPGIPFRHVLTPPREIPVKLHYQYFSLEQTGPAWEAVLRARNFGIYAPGEIVNPQMELVLLPSD